MNKLGYILFNNGNVIGIFDDEQLLNTYIDGCIQNNFFNKDKIKIEKYTMNSLFCHDKINKKINKPELPNKPELLNKPELSKKIDLNKDENYQKLIQEKIDTHHQINELKQRKKKIEDDAATTISSILRGHKGRTKTARLKTFQDKTRDKTRTSRNKTRNNRNKAR
jgi:hypothetical protein